MMDVSRSNQLDLQYKSTFTAWIVKLYFSEDGHDKKLS